MSFYYVQKTCWNCGHYVNLKISLGTTIDNFLDKNMCNNCGCHIRLKDVKQEASE